MVDTDVCHSCDTPDCTCDPSSWLWDGMGHQTPYYTRESLATWNIENRIPFRWMLRVFYGTLACYYLTDQSEKYKYERDVIINRIANTVLNAVVMSCAGESRHVVRVSLHELGLRSRTKYLGDNLWAQSPLGKYTLGMFNSEASDVAHGDAHRRTAGQLALIKTHLYDPQAPLELRVAGARLVRTALMLESRMTGHSIGGCGGLLWVYAADTAYKYTAGKIGAAEFVDSVVDMVHNGGALLNKVWPTDAYTNGIIAFKARASMQQLALLAPNKTRAKFDLPPVRPVPMKVHGLDSYLLVPGNRETLGAKHAYITKIFPPRAETWAESLQVSDEGFVNNEVLNAYRGVYCADRPPADHLHKAVRRMYGWKVDEEHSVEHPMPGVAKPRGRFVNKRHPDFDAVSKKFNELHAAYIKAACKEAKVYDVGGLTHKKLQEVEHKAQVDSGYVNYLSNNPEYPREITGTHSCQFCGGIDRAGGSNVDFEKIYEPKE